MLSVDIPRSKKRSNKIGSCGNYDKDDSYNGQHDIDQFGQKSAKGDIIHHLHGDNLLLLLLQLHLCYL